MALRFAYPASNSISSLNNTLLALKVSRHHPCTLCSTCFGLHPSPTIEIVLDNTPSESSLGDLGQYGSDDDEPRLPYLDTCACNHGVRDHGADETHLGQDEFARRSRVAIRLDELLQNVGKLLDFYYIDDDINSLRMQMRHSVAAMSPAGTIGSSPEQRYHSLPRSPALSDISDPPQPPPPKRRRISSSSLTDAEEAEEESEEDEEENQPLAARMAGKSRPRVDMPSRVVAGYRTGKKPGYKSKKAHKGPLPLVSPTDANGRPNGILSHDTRVKLEEKLDDGQLNRIATGIPVDGGRPSDTHAPIKAEKMSVKELRKGLIQITPVENDRQPRSLVILTGLKTLFQKQLPNMPREYIARIVYDANSKTLAIIKRGYKVVGGICYRPFPHRGFAEIVFFATASVNQDKGYGGMLMDHFKAHIRKTYPKMMFLLTYADNYAVGYFEKQGFSKDITLERSVWAGYIKDYEVSTIMQCSLLQKVDYVSRAAIIAQQQEAVMTKIRELSRSHIVHPGLPQFQPGASEEGLVLDPKDIPGLRESGWTASLNSNSVRSIPRSADHRFMEKLLRDLQTHPQSWAFLTPVNGDDVVDYYEHIKNPMDLSTMEHKLETNQYTSIDAFVHDAQLVFDNCRKYNQEGSIYSRNATKVEKFMKDLIKERLK